MIVTNGVIITSSDQANLGALEQFIEILISNWNESSSKPIKTIPKATKDKEGFVYYTAPKQIPLATLIDFGAELKAIRKDDIIQTAENVEIQAKYSFTTEETLSHAEMLADSVNAIDTYTAEKKDVVASFNSKIQEAEAKKSKYTNYISTGHEWRDVNCLLKLNYQTNKRIFFSKKTGDLVREDPMTDSDYQMAIEW